MRTIDLIQAVNDAAALQAVLLPLLKNAVASGAAEVPDEDVAAARAKLDADIARVESKIEAMPGAAA